MAGIVAVVREHRAAPGLVLRKAAGCQHHPTVGDDLDLAFLGADNGAGHGTIDPDQPLDRRIGPDLGAKVEG